MIRCLALVFLAALTAPRLPAEDAALRAAFSQPSNEARPWAWWFWIDGHISADGLRTDLAEMDRKGIGGINVFNVARPGPKGPIRYMSREWLDLMKLTGADAKRRGFPFIVHEAAGWSGSGGPWVKVEDSMQILTWSETAVNATGGEITARLGAPPSARNFYRDIAVLAFPTPATEQVPPFPKPTVVPRPDRKASDILRFDFPQPVKAATITWTGRRGNKNDWITLEALAADGTWRKMITFDGVVYHGRPTVTASFAPFEARSWRLRASGAPLGDERFVLSAAPRLFNWEFKAAFQLRWGHDGGARANPPESEHAAAAADALDPAQIHIVSSHMTAAGELRWTPPQPGSWTIIRLGHTTNEATQHPAPAGGGGLEPDSLSPSGKGVQDVFTHSVDRLLAADGADLRGKLTGVESDSWEFGAENWTDGLREEFQRRCGYDPLPWLVVSAGGRFVGSSAQSEAFLWDMRRVLADLLAENYYGRLHRAARERGLLYYSEASGAQQFLYDGLNYLRPSDVPMGENWYDDGLRSDCKIAASVAQLYGQRLVGCETFTAGRGRWSETPFELKRVADAGFAAGINHVIIHNYTHQPSNGPGPGFTLGKYGINDNRLNTWWEQSAGFHGYLARCSAVLQHGRTVADVLYMLADDVPSGLSYERGPWRNEVPGILPAGYDFTACNIRALRDRVTVRDGRFVLPNGAEFRLLVLPNRTDLTPEAVQCVRDLVQAGGIVVGPKPVRSPSLRGWPDGNRRVRELADEVWGRGEVAAGRDYGRGRIFSPQPLANLLQTLAVAPDLSWTGAAPDAVDYIHRRTDEADVYFLSNRTDASLQIEASFRVARGVPELWDPLSGTMVAAEIFRHEDARTVVPLTLAPGGSVFVVLPARASAARHYARVRGPLGLLSRPEARAAGRYELEAVDGTRRTVDVAGLPRARSLEGAWDVTFHPPGGAPFSVKFDALLSWPQSADERVKYFSGAATYRKSFELSAESPAEGVRFELDLGNLDTVAEVRLNGNDLPTLWTPPFRIDVTKAVRAGANQLEIRVTNTWINRLIGDEQLPADVSYAESGALAKIPEWNRPGASRPSGRQTFSFWRQYNAQSPLVPAGLHGPVVLRAIRRLPPP